MSSKSFTLRRCLTRRFMKFPWERGGVALGVLFAITDCLSC